MKHQDQNPIETLESPWQKVLLSAKRAIVLLGPIAPHMCCLSGRRCLMAGHMYGYETDSEGVSSRDAYFRPQCSIWW